MMLPSLSKEWNVEELNISMKQEKEMQTVPLGKNI